MAIKFQYNKTSLQALEKQLQIRERALPTLKNKESALRVEVKRARDRASELEQAYHKHIDLLPYIHLSNNHIEIYPERV